MDYRDDPAREPLARQILSAATLPEVRAAQIALRRWRQRYPDDWGILDAGEQLSLIEDALLVDNSSPSLSSSWTEWQRLEYQVMGARSLPEITASRHALSQWGEHHPEKVQAELVESLFFCWKSSRKPKPAQASRRHGEIRNRWGRPPKIMAEQPDFVIYKGKRMVAYWPARIEAAQQEPTYVINGQVWPRMRYGEETDDWGADRQPCHDCRVDKGQLYVPSCDVEQCPRCGEQALSCDCDYEGDDGEAEATA